MNYREFLETKVVSAEKTGIKIQPSEINENLLPHQKDAVLWAVAGGKRALFEAFGLGKTVQQLEWCRLIIKHEGGKALIICPLGVKQEFTHDAVELLGMKAPTYVRNMEEIQNCDNDIMITK